MDSTDITHTRTRVQRSQPFPQRPMKPPEVKETMTHKHVLGTDLLIVFSFLTQKKYLPNLMQSQIVQALSQMGITPMAQRVAMTYNMIAGRLALAIPKEFGMYLKRPLGHKLHLGLCNRLCTDSMPTLSSKGVDLGRN